MYHFNKKQFVSMQFSTAVDIDAVDIDAIVHNCMSLEVNIFSL